MKNRAARILIVVSMLCWAAVAQNHLAGTPGLLAGISQGNISGTVRTLDGYPVANARIELHELTAGTSLRSSYSNETGAFEIVNVPSGTYEIVAYSGLADARETVQVTAPRTSITLRLASSTSSDNLSGAASPTVSVSHFNIPSKAREAFKRAQAAANALKIEDAAKFVAKALTIYPRYAEAMALRGILKLDGNDAKSATADLEQAVQFDPGYPVAYMALGAAYNMQSRFDDALRTIDRGIALAPMSWQGYFEMGKAYVGKGDFSKAIQQLNKAEDLAPKAFPVIHLVKAHALLGAKDYENAMAELESYLSRDPKGPNSDAARLTLEKLRAFAATANK